MYLRCYPHDIWRMAHHQKALRHYARALGLSEPSLYLDNGVRSVEPRPELERLLAEATRGAWQVVLVPGPFVFSIHDVEARAIRTRIHAAGSRVIELPSRCGCG